MRMSASYECDMVLNLSKLVKTGRFVRVLDRHPYGSLVLVLLVWGIGFGLWAATH